MKIVSFLLLIVSIGCAQAQLQWDWSTINHSWDDLKTINWPQNFQWGIGDSAYQTEGEQSANGTLVQNNWCNWPIKNNQKVGVGVCRWDRYKEDIDLIVAAGFNTYRTSLEWAKIEPQEGVFDEDALQHYVDVCAYAKNKGLTVMMVLWHHTWPLWFDALGAFEKRENNKYFARFAEKVCKKLDPYVDFWAPLNEPAAYAMGGYFVGMVPPGKKSPRLAGKVLFNLLEAHVDATNAIKSINPNAQVGIIHVVTPIDCYRWWNPLEQALAITFDHLINNAVISYFTSGTFSWKPFFYSDSNPNAPQSIDFFGVNYYTARKFKILPWVEDNAVYPGEKQSDNGYVIYPEGLYTAIKKCAQAGKPLIITENGLAGDTHRDEFIRKHVSVVSKAVADGFDIRGYHYWTLMDNFEWLEGYDQKFGLYHVDMNNPEMPRTLQPGAQDFIDFLRN